MKTYFKKENETQMDWHLQVFFALPFQLKMQCSLLTLSVVNI